MATTGFGFACHEIGSVNVTDCEAIQFGQILLNVWFCQNGGDAEDYLIWVTEASTANHCENEIGEVEFNWHGAEVAGVGLVVYRNVA